MTHFDTTENYRIWWWLVVLARGGVAHGRRSKEKKKEKMKEKEKATKVVVCDGDCGEDGGATVGLVFAEAGEGRWWWYSHREGGENMRKGK